MVKAKFTGQSSMGFTHGKTYNIRTSVQDINSGGKIKSCLCVYDRNSKAWCPYSGLEAFLKNWRVVAVYHG